MRARRNVGQRNGPGRSGNDGVVGSVNFQGEFLSSVYPDGTEKRENLERDKLASDFEVSYCVGEHGRLSTPAVGTDTRKRRPL